MKKLFLLSLLVLFGCSNESLSPGTDVKLTALPALGFEFLEWSNGVTENPINIKMNSDIDLTAVFKTD